MQHYKRLKQVGNSRQSSSVVNFLGSFFWRPIKCLLVCDFSPFLYLINDTPYLFPRKYNNYAKATCIVSSNLCLFTCPWVTGFPSNPQSQRHISVKGVSQIHHPVSGVNFSNNILIPRVRFNIKKTEHGTTFEIC